MAELQSCVDRLQQDNDRLRARLEEDRGDNARGSSHPAPPVKHNKGKEPILPGDSDTTTDDELSFGSSLLPNLPPQRSMWRLSQEKGPHAVPIVPSVACIAEHEEKLAESHESRSRPLKTCPRGTGV